jgi:aspartate aminotransferase-like enzyme
MAIIGVTPPAWDAMERRKHKATSYVYDLLRWRDSWIPASRGGKVPDGGKRMQPISMPTQLTHALGVAVRLVLEEGLEARFRRHAVAGRAFRAGIEAMRLEMFSDKSIQSDTVSCVKTPAGIEPAAVVSHMRQHFGILIGTGLDKIRTTTLRIGHMGITASPLYVLPTLSALEMTLRELGYRSEAGAGVAAAQAIFADSAA